MKDYDAWKTGWYDMGSKHCNQCENKEEILDEAYFALQKVIDQLYGSGSLEKNTLEENLDTLCHLFKIELRTSDLCIERKSPINAFTFTEPKGQKTMDNFQKIFYIGQA